MKHNDLINESEKIFLESLEAPSTEDSNLKEGMKRLIRRGGIKVTPASGKENKKLTPTTPRAKEALADTQRRYGRAEKSGQSIHGDPDHSLGSTVVPIGGKADQATTEPIGSKRGVRAEPGSDEERRKMPNPRFNPHGTNPGSPRHQKVGWKRGVKKPLAQSAEMENSNQDPNLKEDKKHDGSISGQPATFKKGKELESTKGKGYRLVKKKWKLASEMENSNQDPNLKEAVSDSGTQLQRIYKSGELAGSGKFSGEKNHGEVQDQLDRIRNKGRKLALKDKKIKPKLKSKLMTPSQGGGDVATEKSLVKGITKGKAINRAIRALPK